MNQTPLTAKVIGGILLSLFIAVGIFWATRGYGKISPNGYDYATALYGACLAKSEPRIARVAIMLEQEQSKPTGDPIDRISQRERGWLEGIVQLARQDQWERAAKMARRMMEDQVEY